MSKTLLGSLCRIADLDREPYDIERLDRDQWANGDYVLGEVKGPVSKLYKVEDTTGEMIPVEPGDRVVGAFGHRAATLEGVGSFEDMIDDTMQCLTNAGLYGRFTSLSKLLPSPISLEYRGHVVRDGNKLTMSQFAKISDGGDYNRPTILLVGTSMSAGKTMTGKLTCKILTDLGLKVIGAKLTGAGRYRDILSFRDAGAFEVYDFVDVGLASTVVDEAEFRRRIRPLLHHIQLRNPDYVVVEAGASPLEPYNGKAAIDELNDSICMRVLCASDPYAVVGVQNAFGLKPDVVTGPAANTSAAVDLVEKLTGVRAINIIDPDAEPEYRQFLVERLGLG